jgi:uncharacterized membrane protein YhhN
LFEIKSNTSYNNIMNNMRIFLIVFTLVSVVHIASIALAKGKLERISKALIIPSLLGAYLAGAGDPRLLVVLALVLGWMGDVLLIKIENPICFKLGLASFLLGHLCYIFTFVDFLGFFAGGGPECLQPGGKINGMALAVFVPLAVFLGIIMFRFVKPSREMTIPVILYMIVIQVMAFWGFEVFIASRSFAGALVFSGCFLFMISDTTLAYCTFGKLTIPRSVVIMTTYILAQAGIILGMLSF